MNTFSQSSWELLPHIEKNDYYLLEGTFTDGEEFEMYLTKTWEICGDAINERENSQGLKGWYQLKNEAKKHLLVGSINQNAEVGASSYFIKLFVPQNPLATIDDETCEIADYKELFVVDACCSMQKMNWKKQGKQSFQQIELKEIHPSSWETEASLNLSINELELLTINLTDLTKIKYIDSVEVLAAKEIDGQFYAIIEFGHMTNPGSNGMGFCGAGYEAYLGFIQINASLDIVKFEFHQTESCNRIIPEDKYTFNKEHPENGILEKE